MTMLGHLLLRFGMPSDAVVPGFAAVSETWSVGATSPTDDWNGFPYCTAQEGPWSVVALGEILGDAAKRHTPERLALDVAAGRRKATELSGMFLIAAWNDVSREWHLWTDRLGVLHAYFGSNGGRAAIGTSFYAVSRAAEATRIDLAAVGAFFQFGFFPGSSTYYEEVSLLPAGSHCVFDENGAPRLTERYWNWVHQPRPADQYSDAVDEFASVFHQVVDQNAAEGTCALPLSGGLDSRSLLSAVTKDGWRPGNVWTYSYGYSPASIENKIAGELASRAGLSHESYTIGPYLFDAADRVVQAVEGFQEITQTRQAAVMPVVKDHATSILCGHIGDIFLDDMGVTADAQDLRAFVSKKMRKKGSGWFAQNAAWITAGVADEQVRSRLQSLGGIEDADFRVKALKLDTWVFRWTNASLRMFQSAAYPRVPFYDGRLVDFFMTVPTEWVAGRRMQIDYLKRYAPTLAKVTWQAYDANLHWYTYSNSLMLPKRAMKKAWRVVTGQRVTEANWEVQFLHPAAAAEIDKRLTAPGLRLHEFFPQAAIRSLLAEFRANPWADGRSYTVAALLTFSCWLEGQGTSGRVTGAVA